MRKYSNGHLHYHDPSRRSNTTGRKQSPHVSLMPPFGRSTYSRALLVATSLPGRKKAEETLILRPVNILNGETPVDAWTVVPDARRARPRLGALSCSSDSLVKAFSSPTRV